VKDPRSTLTRSVGLSVAALLTSATTLVCCVLPAVLVTLGAGATLAGLVAALPQLIWLSEHKPLVFGVAGALLLMSGGATWYARLLPCPVDPAAARLCRRLRLTSVVLYGIGLVSFALGAAFAFLPPVIDP
jgi:hypothetical protein